MRFESQVTFLAVRDLDRAADFYGRVMGLEMVLDQGSCRIYAIGGNAFVGVCLRPEAPADRATIITLVVNGDEAVDAAFGKATAAGATVVFGPRYNEQYRIYQCMVSDPDGHHVEIQHFHDPAWRHRH